MTEEKKFDELVRQHLKAVYSFAYRFVGDAHEAEDIVQETFLKAWKNFGNYKAEMSQFKTWLMHIARNTAIDHLRKKKHIAFSEFTNDEGDNSFVDTLADTEELPEELLACAEDTKVLTDALDKLSPPSREVLILHYTNSMTFEEIGAILGKSMNTVKSRHRRAIAVLRKNLEADKLRIDK